MSGNLYLVATPIGNLEDITLRALKILKEVDIIAAEDTRHTLKLLNHFEISKPLISYYKQTEKHKGEIILNKLLEGKNIALVSDAGTPVISDPGEEIVKLAIKNEIKIIPVPGACACISSLIASGLPASNFSFFGFLPVNNNEKINKLNEIKDYNTTLIFYEAPHKLINTLNAIKEVFGNRNIVLCRELTKIHEEFIRGSISDILENFTNPRGEFVIIVQGCEKKVNSELDLLNKLSLNQHYEYYSKKGLTKKEIIKQIAKDRNVSKNEIYKYFFNDKS